MKPSVSFFLPLRLLILFFLSVSSLAHTPPAHNESHEATSPPAQKMCLCPCPCHEATSPHAHNKSHETTSPPAQNKSHEGSTSPPSAHNKSHKATSPPAQNKGHKGSSLPPTAHDKSREATSPPAHDKSHGGSILPPPAQKNRHEATSPPAQNKGHEATSPHAHNKSHETTSPPAQNKSHEGSTSPPSAHNKSHKATSPPAQNKGQKGHKGSTLPPTAHDKSREATSPPAHDKSHGGSILSPPAQKNRHEATSPPAQNKGREASALPPPAQNKSHEATSSPAHNKSHEGSNLTPPAQNKRHEATSPPAQNKGHEGSTLPPLAQNKSHEATAPPAQNKSHEGSTLPNSYEGFFSQVFAFGESFTDRGNAFRLENNASSSNQQSQFCDGHLLVDFLCDALALPTLPPYKATVNFTFGVNFAIAGSTALPNSIFDKLKASGSLWKGMPAENFQTQIDWFYKFRSQLGCKDENICKAKMADALFWIGELGIDDYIRTHGLTLPHQWLAENSVAGVARILQALLDSGARYIVVQGLPPVGCLPVDITACPLHLRDHLGCAPVANAAIKVHNQLLQRELRRLRALHPECSILYADYWSAYLTILGNPAKYNFEEPFKACCGASGDLNFNIHSLCGSPGTSKCNDPSKYINWDGIHLTQAMHKHVANLFINQGYCQPSFAELMQHKRGTYKQ